MLPSVLNSSYDKILHPTELSIDPEDRSKTFLVNRTTSLAFSSLDIEAQARSDATDSVRESWK